MSPTELFADNFTTTLAQPCLATDATLYITAPLPASLQAVGEFRLNLTDPTVPGKVALLTASMGASATTLTVTWGLGGTTAQPFPVNASVSAVLTAEGEENALVNAEQIAESAATAALAVETARAEAAEASGLTVPPGTPAGRVPVTSSEGNLSFENLAILSGAVPNPDTFDGSAGASGEVVDAAHSHPRSLLYDGHGQDDVNVVAESGVSLDIPDPADFQSSFITLTADCQINFPTAALGKRFTIALGQDSVGGRAPSFPSSVAWPSGVVPTWSTGPGEIDLATFESLDGVNWYCLFAPVLSAVPPPTPVSIVQSVFTVSANNPTNVALPNNVGVGNALLLYMHPASGTLTPRGGGVNWVEVDLSAWALSNDNTQAGVLWLGLDSSGGEGTSVIDFSPDSSTTSGAGMLIELDGIVFSDPVDGVPAVLNTNVSQGPETVGPIISPHSGDAVVFLVDGMTGYGTGVASNIDGTETEQITGIFTTQNGWNLFVPPPALAYLPRLAIKLTSVAGQGYNLALAHGGWTGDAGVLGLFLKNRSI